MEQVRLGRFHVCSSVSCVVQSRRENFSQEYDGVACCDRRLSSEPLCRLLSLGLPDFWHSVSSCTGNVYTKQTQHDSGGLGVLLLLLLLLLLLCCQMNQKSRHNLRGFCHTRGFSTVRR